MTDGELLRCYARDRSEAAFGELVRRHIDFVYSAALRQINGDVHLAEDVTQSIFSDLARKAASLTRHTSLAGWLYTSTRFVAANVRRAEQRRRTREREAYGMNTLLQPTEPEPDWAQIRPLLDEAMHTLDEQDREAVLLRHFERWSYAKIAARFALTEDAARMRVERALKKLHAALMERGVRSTAMALAGLLTAHAVGAAPAHLAAHVMRKALAGGAAAGGLSVLLAQLLAASKIKLVAGVVGLAVVVAVMVAFRQTGQTHPGIPATSSAPVSTPSRAESPTSDAATTNSFTSDIGPPSLTNQSVLHLEIVAADSGKPLPMVQIDYEGWTFEATPEKQSSANGEWTTVFVGKPQPKQFVADRMGACDIVYGSDPAGLDLFLHLEGFADTRLLWSHGLAIPTNFTVRLDRAVPIGGRVVDPDGNPVAGAKISWNHQEDPAARKRPQFHELGKSRALGSLEVTTDGEGRWQVSRMAEDILARCYAIAQHTNYVHSEGIYARQDQTVEKQLRDGTYVFRLRPAVTATGVVVDAHGSPISEARVIVGGSFDARRREAKTRSDGTFFMAGCAPGKQWVSAEAESYAPTTLAADFAANATPVRLVLQRGTALRLRVVDKDGNPIRWAHAMLNSDNDPGRPVRVQADFFGNADADGRIVWTNAPDADLSFDVQATRYMNAHAVTVRPDGEEHVITLPSALVVHGTVRDESNGQPIPKFRIVAGWPERNSADGTPSAHWSNEAQFWFDFANGEYSQTFVEAVALDRKSQEYILRFEADGYTPWVSPVIAAEAGDVQLDAALRPVRSLVVTVYKPDGQLADNTDVGLISPGVHLLLNNAGLARGNSEIIGSLLQTRPNGQFALRSDDSITRIVAASSDGYAEATPAALSGNPVLQLQPWGRLEVTCLASGKATSGREYQLDFSGGILDSISFEPKVEVKTDEQGRFSVSQLPPGQHQLTRLRPQLLGGLGKSWEGADKASFEIRPGETTTLTLAGSSCTVAGRLRWPAGVERKPGWVILARVETPGPVAPPETGINETARAAFYESVEYQAFLQNRRTYPATEKADGIVSAEDVEPGDYRLFVAIGEMPDTPPPVRGKVVLEGSVPVTVPPDPSTRVLDVGVIDLHPTPARH